MALPPRQRAAFEVIESEFVLEFLILLFDRPALMREPHERAQRRGRGQVHEVVLGAGRGAAVLARRAARLPGRGDRRRHACAGVMRWAAKRAVQARAARAFRHVTERHAAAGHVATSVATEHGVCPGGRIGVVRGRPPRPATAGGRASRGGRTKTPDLRRNPHRVGNPGAVPCRAERGIVAKFRIGHDRGDPKAGGANLPKQRQGVAPLFLEWDRRRNPSRGSAPRVSATPAANTAERRAATRACPSTTPASLSDTTNSMAVER